MTEDELNQLAALPVVEWDVLAELDEAGAKQINAVPALIEEIRRLRALVEKAEWAHTGSHEYGDWCACPWCDGESDHDTSCPAFSGVGHVR